MEWGPTGVLIDRVRAGERGDVLIAIDQPIAELVEQGVLRDGSVRPVARASFGLGVKRGRPRPNISTPERFRAGAALGPIRRLLADRCEWLPLPGRHGASGHH